MIAVVTLALLGSALAAPQFNQLAQQPQVATSFASTFGDQPLPKQQPLPQQFAPAPVVQQTQQFAQQPQQLVQQPQQVARAPITVLKRTELSDDNGNFQTSVTQSDGSQFEESGSLEPTNDMLDKVVVKKGSYQYTSPEGLPVRVDYTADRYGFHPHGTLIPV